MPETDLARFADRAGFDHELLAGGDGHWIENAPADFDGRIEAIRITRYGRFGNVFYQTLHAVALARLLGCHTVFASPLTDGPPEAAVQLAGLRIVLRVKPGMDRVAVPTLVGHFFAAEPFESALRGLAPEAAWEIIRRDLLPLFGGILGAVRPVGSRTLVMSFRAGDIFRSDTIHPGYVQPPASYYVRALDFARARLGVTDVGLVFEDDGNPAIGCVQAHLQAQAVPYTVQSAGPVEDLTYLAGASHLVAPYSTFGEVAAIMSREIRTYFGFRNFESHQPLHLRQTPLLLGVLRGKGVRTVLIDDAAGLFTAPQSWERSPAQLRLIADYPIENLLVLEGEDAEAREAAQAAAAAGRQVLAVQQETRRLRGLLLTRSSEADAAKQLAQEMQTQLRAADDLLAASRQEAEAAQALLAQTQSRLDELNRAFLTSTSWRITAPLRWLSRKVSRIGTAHQASRL
jgi:hypothetical protein